MVMRAFSKTVFRGIKSNLSRMISIFFIILLGIAFVSGFGTLSPSIKKTYSNYLNDNNASDIIIKSKQLYGFTEKEISSLTNDDDIRLFSLYTVIDMEIDGKNGRIYGITDDLSVDKVSIIEGRFPENSSEIMVQIKSNVIDEYKIGDVVEYNGSKLSIVGIAENPLIFQKRGEPDFINNEALEIIIYFNSNTCAFPITDIRICLRDTIDMYRYSKSYEDTVMQKVTKMKESYPDYEYLTIKENVSSIILLNYCDKVTIIAVFFPVFFIAVAALVVLNTMTRLVEEERSIIACYETLGVSSGKILFRYLSAIMAVSIIASLLGIIVGIIVLPSVIYPAFEILFYLKPFSNYYSIIEGIIASCFMIFATSFVTFYVVYKNINCSPASILRPKSPKTGRKILLEKIPFIWNHLSFKYKSTYRNIFRYRKHLLMTIISVSGSTALVMAGFSLSNIANNRVDGSLNGLGDTLKPIAAVVIIFALLLSIFVIYNLTNMNISERQREIATLDVLGYHTEEKLGYIYREILIMSIFGILLGIPLGCVFINYVLLFIDFGSISDVSIEAYLLSGLLILAFILIVDLLLIPKIKKIDMTNSLKRIE